MSYWHKLKNIFIILLFSLCHLAKAEENIQESSSVCQYERAKNLLAIPIPGEETLAEKLLINCIRFEPKRLSPILTLAKLIEQQVSAGEKPVYEIRKSVALVSQAYSLAPNNPEVRYQMVHMLTTMGEYEQAQALYEETVEEFPNSKETLIEQSKLLIDNNPEKSLKLIESSLQMGTDISDVLDIIVSCYRKITLEPNSVHPLEHLVKKFPHNLAFHKLGLLYLEHKKYREAAKAFQNAINIENKSESKLQLAILQYQFLKEYKNSINNFSSLIKEIEENKYIHPSSHALVYSHYSLALYLNNQKEEASNIAKQAVIKDYNKREYMQSLIFEYKDRAELKILKPALEIVITNDPTFDNAYAALGEIYKEEKNYDQSIDMLDKSIILNPKNDSYYFLRANIFYKTKDYERALWDFEYAIELNPKMPIYVYNKACILALMGKKKEALIYLKIALNNDRKLLELAKNDLDFSVIKSDPIYSAEFASLLFQNYDKIDSGRD